MKSRWIAAVAVFWGLVACASIAHAGPRLGRAVLAGVEGKATIETPEGAFDADEGMALSHGHALITEAGSSVCALLTPGALICVHGDSRVELEDLQHTATQGLPGPGQDAHGRIVLGLTRGAILVNGRKGPAELDLLVNLGGGVTLSLPGAECIIARDKDGVHVLVEQGEALLNTPKGPHTVKSGQTLRLGPGADGDVTITDSLAGRSKYDFYVCREVFPSLEPLAQDWSWEEFDAAGGPVADGARLALVTRPSEALDVSPSTRDVGDRLAAFEPPVVSNPSRDGGIRPRVEMWDWYRGVGLMRGVNYLPRDAVNSTEMWQADTFNPDLINEELGWAHDSGFTSVRVFLPFQVWQQDAKGFGERFAKFLDLADDHRLTVVPVLFDDYTPHGLEPVAGQQPEPTPGVHNSQWTPSPGHRLVTDRASWPQLEAYVKDLVKRFGDDNRILFWDLYNDPGRSGMGDRSLPLVVAAFDWARAAKPEQPLTAGVNAFLSPAAAGDIMKRSDIVTFSGYESRAELEGGMAMAGLRGRPVICTGWLDRTQDLTYESVLPMFSRNHVGWYQWGLVAGRSQLQVPPANRQTGADVWAQALLGPDGKPYRDEEVDLIRQFIFEER